MSASVQNPYPGLRPFQEAEEHLFFGRERHVDTMVDRLAETRFLSVVGTSGSGKSSLVNCGLRPALHRGLMASAGTRWRMAQFRPGNNPLAALAAALAAEGVLYTNFNAGDFSLSDILATTLRMSRLGLVDAFQQARLGAGVNLLVVVDQFEELFRYRGLGTSGTAEQSAAAEEAIAFINLLLEARAQQDCPIYIVLTMRSDFLGDCAQFFGLPEAVSAGQYLVPRLTRDERRLAIVGPAGVSSTEVSPVLVTRLVNDVGDNPDQLSILQHALNRTWARWWHETDRSQPLDLREYEAVGTMAHALDAHAEKAYAELHSAGRQKICEKIFKALTDRGTDARGIRRPTRLSTLCALAQATQEQVIEVIEIFRAPSRSFLMPPAGEPLHAETVLDISHESLMRVWDRLRIWVQEEARSAQVYRRIDETAELHASSKAGLWRDPELQMALDWRKRNEPNETWAAQYRPNFARAMHFLDKSRDIRDERVAAQTRRRNRRLWLARTTVLASALVAIVMFSLYRSASVAKQYADSQRADALSQQLAAEVRGTSRNTPYLSLLLGVAAETQAQSPATRQALLEALQQNARLVGYMWQDPSVARKDSANAQRTIAFSADGRWLASAEDKTIILWDVASRKAVGKPLSAGSEVTALGFQSSGGLLVSGHKDGRIVLWDAARQLPVGEPLFDALAPVTHVAFRTDGMLVSVTSDGTVGVWDLATHKLSRKSGITRSVSGNQLALQTALNANGEVLAAVFNGNRIRIWDVARRMQRGETLRVGDSQISVLALSRDGEQLAAGTYDGMVSVWHINSNGQPIQRRVHPEPVMGLAFNSDGTRLASSSFDRRSALSDPRIVLSDLKTMEPVGRPFRSGLRAEQIVFDGSQLMAEATPGNGVVLWDTSATMTPLGEPLVGFERKSGDKSCPHVAFSSDSKVLTAACGGRVARWNLATHQLVDGESREPCAIRKVGGSGSTCLFAVHTDGRMLATSGDKDGIVLYGLAGQRFELPDSRDYSATALALSPDRRVLVSGDAHGGVTLWDVNAHKRLANLPAIYDAAILTLGFSSNGQLLATGNESGKVTVWNVDGQIPTSSYDFANLPVQSVTLSADGALLAASVGTDLTIWDTKTRKALTESARGQRSSRQNGWIYAVTFSPDAQFLAAATENGVALRDLSARRSQRLLLRSFGDSIRDRADIDRNTGKSSQATISVSFAPDGKSIASGGVDGRLTVWAFDREVWHERACSMAGRNLSPAEWEEAFGGQDYKTVCEHLPVDSALARSDQDHDETTVIAAGHPDAESRARQEAAQSAIKLLTTDPQTLISSQVRLRRAIEAYQRAEDRGSTDVIREAVDANQWNSLCWQGALQGHANVLMFTCENAVESAPSDIGYVDSRGVAKAFTGNYMGAAEDFKTYVQWLKEPEQSDNASREYLPQRERWIQQLQQNRDPFTEEDRRLMEHQ